MNGSNGMKMQKFVALAKENIEDKYAKYNTANLGTIVIIQMNIEVLHIAHVI